MNRPRVSAIVTVYNRASLVGKAVESLAAQTLKDIEIIVVDDGSTDGSAEAVDACNDKRVRIVRHSVNRGIPAARNTGLEAAQGEFIAWLDSDDISRPDRLARQAAFLDRHPETAMVGSCAGRMNLAGVAKRRPRVPLLIHEDLAPALLLRSAFQQSSIMGQATILKELPYRAEFPVCEDLDMFIRLVREHRVANLPEVLIDRRLHSGQTIHIESSLIRDRKRILFRDSLTRLGITATDEELNRHITLGWLKQSAQSGDFLDWSEQWLARLLTANDKTEVYDRQGLALVVARAWLLVCRAALAGPDRGHAARRMLASPLTRHLANRHGRRWLGQALPLMAGLR